jgi:hypothetical protein
VVHLEWSFAKPPNMRTDFAAARTVGDVSSVLKGPIIVERRTSAIALAPALKNLPVHVNEPPRPRHFMRTVDILGAEKQTIANFFFKRGERVMSWIRLPVRCRRRRSE